MAASVVMTVPIAFLFLYFQKLFVGGLDGRRDRGMTNSQTIDHSACNQQISYAAPRHMPCADVRERQRRPRASVTHGQRPRSHIDHGKLKSIDHLGVAHLTNLVIVNGFPL
ncbi:hypothetical protein GFPCMMHI_03226 [Ensifer adhaerens]|nr:hypothetical protein [Ensifer adhaerens]